MRYENVATANTTPRIDVLEYEKKIAGSMSAEKPQISMYCCFLVNLVDDSAHPAKRESTIVRNTENLIGPPKLP